MSDYVIIVPKQDELQAIGWAFGVQFRRPDQRIRAGVELHRRSFPFGTVTFALLDRQTNTYSSILTAEVIAREAPRLAFLAGTALGRPGHAPLGSVVVSDGVIDISEKRYTDANEEFYVSRGPIKSDELTLDAKDFIHRSFTKEKAQARLRLMARTPRLLTGTRRINEFIATHDPTVLCEAVVSGNEYRMGGSSDAAGRVWSQSPTARAYDMEAAGFVLAATIRDIPWLVIRGISDHGTPETKSDFNRTVAAGLAGRFLSEFLQDGLVRAAEVPISQETTTTLPLLRDEAYRLDGTWIGAMAYLADNGDPVVFQEAAEFSQEGSDVQGVIRSRLVRGVPRHEDLRYRVSFSVARHGYAGGVWSEVEATRRYFGVMLGVFDEDSTVLAGTWLGTHRLGVRRGFFKWFNTSRSANGGRDLGSTVDDLLASFSSDWSRVYNDACRVSQ